MSLSPEHDAAAWEPVEAATARLSEPQTAAVETAIARHRRVRDHDADGATSTPHEHGEPS